MNNPNNFKSSLRAGMVISALLLIFFPLKALDTELNALQMSCISWLQVSVGANGEAVLTPQMLLSNPQPNYNIFEVSIVDPPIGGNVVDCSLLEQTISVMVTNTVTNNSCWSMVYVEDKLAPVIECTDRELPCWESIDYDDPDFFLDTLFDNCTPLHELDVWYSQSIHGLNCDPYYTIYLTRIWTATDNYGQSSTCEQTIYFQRGQIFEVEFPLDTILDCPAVDVSPDITGRPTLAENELGPLCGIDVQYTDVQIPLCGESFKIMRTWTLWDWCTMQMRFSTQTVEVKDTIAPELTCPADLTIFTAIQTCNATYIFPSIQAEDACSEDSDIQIRFKVNGVLVFDPLTVLPLGENTIEVQAIDPCNNMSICEYTVTVEDNVPPVLVCENLVISLTNDEPLRVPVEVITSGFTFTDNCGIGEVEIRRMEDLCSSPEDLDFGDSIAFCCEDVKQSVMAEVKVTDVNGNANFCMFEITIQDKVAPVIISCAPDSAITCDQLSLDFSRFGEPEAIGLCELVFDFEVSVEIDSCWEGNVFVTHYVFNSGGIGDSCVQTLTVTNPFDFSEDNIIWPLDTVIVSCPGSIDPNEINSHPEVTADACHGIIQFGFSDSIAIDNDFCSTIYRTWITEQSCYPGLQFTHVQRIDLLNPGEPEITDQVPTSAVVACFEEAIDPELPTVEDACGRVLTPVSSSVFDDPSGADCEGVRVYTYTYEDCNGNTLEWTFTYTIEYEGFSVPENEVMVVSCPDDTDNLPEPPLVNDSCGNLIQPSGPEMTEKPDCEGERTYTWTYTDCANNSHDWVFTYTIEYEDFTLPIDEGATVSCPDSTDVVPTPPVVLDACGNAITPAGPEISVKPSCEGSRTYTWTYTDCANNSHDWVYTYTVVYEDFIVPADGSETVSCPDSTDIVPSTPVVRDTCQNIIIPTGPVISAKPDCEGSRTYIWTYTDCANNSHDWVFTYTVEYEIFTVAPDGSETVSCPDSTDVVPTLPVVLDACGNELTPTGPVVSDKPDCEGERTYTWTYTDCAGNSHNWVFTYTVEYEDFPVPENDTMIVACGDSIPLPDPIQVFDNCGNELTGELISQDTIPTCEGEVVYTFQYGDCAQNTQLWSFVYIIQVTQAPLLPDNEQDTITCPDPDFEPIPPSDIVDQCGNPVDPTGPEVESFTDTVNNVQIIVYSYEYEDCAGNVSIWTHTLVIEVDDLEIVCPSNIEVSNDPGLCEADITIEPAVVTGGCGIDSLFNSFNFTEDASDIYPVGETEVSFIVIDITGVTASCIFTVTVNDEEPPVIDCPSDLTVSTDNGECFATDIELGDAEANDNCPGVMVQITIPDTFEVGVTIVVYTAVDASGNSISCEQIITVEDNENPTIECPANAVVFNDGGECFATEVDFDAAAVADNCGIDTVIISAPDTFLLGITTIVHTVTDIYGNTASCETSITVVDNELPVLECPDEIIVEVDPGECEAEVTVVITATDNCTDSLLITNTFNDGGADASGIYPLGETLVVFTVEDEAGNVDSCSVTVIIEGDEPLEIECPEDIIQANDPDSCEASITIPPATVTGGCGIESITNDFNFTEDASGIYPVGETVVEFTVVDSFGASATCTFLVIVEDNENPLIVCPEDIVQENDPGECGADIEVTVVSFSDNCGIDTIFNDFSETIAADGFYSVDTTVVTYTVIDVNGNSAECSFTVVIFDNEIPMLTCPDDVVIEVDPGECEAMVTGLIASATDNCTDSLVIVNSFNDGGADASDLYPLGGTIVVFTVTDEAGNIDSCSVTVLIEGDEPLEVICPEDIMVDNDPEECFAFVSIDSAMVTGGCGLDSLFNDFNFTADATDFYNVGVTVVTFTAIDEVGAVAICSFTVTVNDTEAPTIECPEDITVSTDDGQCFATDLDLGEAEANDNCLGVEIDVFVSDTFEIGTTSIIYIAIDSSGNTAECEQIVTVEDNEDPIINCPGDIVQVNDSGQCGAFLEIGIPDFSDNCPGASISNDFTNTEDASAFYPVDTTQVTYVVIDANGNSAECSFLVIVFDNEAPEFVFCPPDEEVPCIEYEEGIDLSQFGEPEVFDNCPDGIVVIETFEVDIDSCSSTGIITRMFTAFDEAGNADSSCIQLITFVGISVLDSLDFIWPDEFILITDCSLFNPDSIPGGEPILNPDLETCNQVSIIMEDEFMVVDTACDIIIRTWTVTDLCNPVTGEWVFVQTITVEDTIGPEFILAPTDTIMVFADSLSCDTFVEIIVEAIDDCGGDVIITNNSPFADSSGADASGVYPIGLTTFEFEAVDNCGNVTILEVNVTVVDTIPPVIICNKFRYIIDDNLSAVAVASDFINELSDNCLDSIDINVTFDLSDFDLDTLLFNFTNCDSIPGLFPITIYAIDEFGNIDSCETQIRFDDPNMSCPDSLVGNINGLVYHHDLDRMVEGVDVHLESPFYNDHIKSDNIGLYEFIHVPQVPDLHLRPYKDDDPLNGVTTYDIYLIKRHILGIDVIIDPYYLIAADINNDGSINILDVVELRRLILGVYEQFPNNTSWRFLDKTFTIPYGVIPTKMDLPETVEVYFSVDRFFQQDFVGVKIGDLNGNVRPSGLNKESQTRNASMGLYTRDRSVKMGELVTVDFYFDGKAEFNGIQFDLTCDNFALELENISWSDKLEVDENSYHISFDQMNTSLRLSQSSPGLLSTNDDGYIFSITFTANQSGRLSDWLQFSKERLYPEIFKGFTDLNSLELRFKDELATNYRDERSFELFQNRPNPFSGTTIIPFVTDENGIAELEIFDITGKRVAHMSKNFQTGYNQWEINVTSMGLLNGVYYYQLNVGNHQATRKMIVK